MLIEQKLGGLKLSRNQIATKTYDNNDDEICEWHKDIDAVIVYGKRREEEVQDPNLSYDCCDYIRPSETKNHLMYPDPSREGGGGSYNPNPLPPIVNIPLEKAQNLLDILFSKGKITYNDIGIKSSEGVAIAGSDLYINGQKVFVTYFSIGLLKDDNTCTTSYSIQYNKPTRYGNATAYILNSHKLSDKGQLIVTGSITVLPEYEKIIEEALDNANISK